jgi:demethylmenaquinone methyltransferase/2-methoxy-6-polyprenyl-1,4-benzoquinol methylase
MSQEQPPSGPVPEQNPDASLTGTAKRTYVRGMFTRIADHYDLMNTLMTFGQDEQWRAVVVRAAGPVAGRRTLDVGTGTGRIARDLAARGARAVGLDLTPGMMLAGRKEMIAQLGRSPVAFLCGDALALPLPDNSVACVTTGFTMRNVVDIEGAFREMVRVVQPGGRVICLEVATPRNPLFRLGNYVYTRRIIPVLGRLIARDSDAYSYLPNSMGKFPTPPRLAQIMEVAGLRKVRYRLMMLGSVAVHVGIKP